MAFTPVAPPSMSPTSTVPPEPATEGQPANLTYDATVLSQSAQVKANLEHKSPEQVASAEQESRVQALRAMNALRLLGPAIRAASRQEGDEKTQVDYFVTLLNRANADAVAVTQALGLEPELQKNRWAVNSLERVFVEAYADLPGQSKSSPSALLEAVVAEGITRQFESPTRPFWSQELSVHLALIQGLLPVARAQQAFDFFRQADQDLEQCAELLLTTAIKAVDQLCPPLTPDQERQSLCHVLLHEGGKTLAQVWERESERARNTVRRSGQDLVAWRRANPQGLPLHLVLEGFEQTMHRVIHLAKKARPQVRGR